MVGVLVIWAFFSISEGPADYVMLLLAFAFKSVAISKTRILLLY